MRAQLIFLRVGDLDNWVAFILRVIVTGTCNFGSKEMNLRKLGRFNFALNAQEISNNPDLAYVIKI